MAETLDKLLEPGERVLWRDAPRPRLEGWVRHLSFAAIIAAIWAGVGERHGLETWVTVFGVAIVGMTVAALFLQWLGRHSIPQTILTRDRLLRRGEERIEIAVAEVAGVALDVSMQVIVTRRDGGTTVLCHPRKPQALAAALAEVAGLPPPRLVGRLERLSNYAQEIGPAACFVLAVVLLGDWFEPRVKGGGFEGIAMRGLQFLTVFTAAFAVGLHLAMVAGLVLLRPWVSPEEARTWLDLGAVRRAEETPWNRLEKHLVLWRSPLYARLVTLLWGAAAGGPKEGSESHG